MASTLSSLLSIKVTSPTTPQPNNENSNLQKQVFEFFEALEEEILELDYGTINVSVVIKDSMPSIENTTVLKSKKVKYTYEKTNID